MVNYAGVEGGIRIGASITTLAVLAALPQAMPIATHDTAFAEALSSRVIVLNKGSAYTDKANRTPGSLIFPTTVKS
jgi:ABC-type polar amino acid transport system ATPase subunit